MTKVSFVFLAVLALAAVGCKKKTAGPDCTKAITNSMEVSKADLAKMPGIDAKMMEKMKVIGIEHCTADKWPDSVITCMTDAKTETEAQGCYGKMTPGQREKMNEAAMEMIAPAGAAGAAGGAAVGSDSGSATAPASGSAGTAAPAGTGSAGSAANEAGSAAGSSATK